MINLVYCLIFSLDSPTRFQATVADCDRLDDGQQVV
jgi:hypothetical protein